MTRKGFYVSWTGAVAIVGTILGLATLEFSIVKQSVDDGPRVRGDILEKRLQETTTELTRVRANLQRTRDQSIRVAQLTRANQTLHRYNMDWAAAHGRCVQYNQQLLGNGNILRQIRTLTHEETRVQNEIEFLAHPSRTRGHISDATRLAIQQLAEHRSQVHQRMLSLQDKLQPAR